MKKLKLFLAAILAVFVMFVANKTVDAASTYTYGVALKGAGTWTGTAAEDSSKSMSFVVSTNKSTSLSGTSIITGEETSYSAAAKLNSSGTVSFTTSYDWTAQILIACSAAGNSVAIEGATVEGEITAANTLTVVTASGSAGSFEIKRSASKEVWAFEIVLVESFEADATYYNVNFYDGTTLISSSPVVEGSQATAPKTPVFYDRVFAGWYADAELTTEFDFTQGISAETNVYAKYDTVQYTADANHISPSFIAAMQDTLGSDQTLVSYDLEPTIFTMNAGASLVSRSKTVDGVAYTNAIQFSKTVNLDGKIDSSIEFTVDSACVLVVSIENGSSTSNRDFKVQNADLDDVSVINLEMGTNGRIAFEIPSAGTYYFGGVGGTYFIYDLMIQTNEEYFVENANVLNSLIIDYKNNVATDVQLRFGALLDVIETGATYGVLLFNTDVELEAGLQTATLQELGGVAVECTPTKTENGYQFAAVLTDILAEDFGTSVKAYIYMVTAEGDVVLSTPRMESVDSVVQTYIDNADTLGLSADILEVLNSILAM